MILVNDTLILEKYNDFGDKNDTTIKEMDFHP